MWVVYTSGLGWAQLLAMVVGAFLVLRDPRLTGRPATQPPPADPGPLIVAKAAVAALFAMVLAAVDLAVVLPNAQSHLAGHWVLAGLRRDGVAIHQLTLADGSVWTVTLCALAGVSLFAMIGVGLAARAGRWWLVGVTVGVLSFASLLFMAMDQVGRFNGAAETTFAVLSLVVAVPAAPWALLWYITLSPWAPLAGALTLSMGVCTVLLGYKATRRRLAGARDDAAL